MTDQGPEPDTYLLLGPHLYEVIGWEDDTHRRLRVRNCRTLHDLTLGAAEVERAQVITPTPDAEFVIPPEWGRAAA